MKVRSLTIIQVQPCSIQQDGDGAVDLNRLRRYFGAWLGLVDYALATGDPAELRAACTIFAEDCRRALGSFGLLP